MRLLINRAEIAKYRNIAKSVLDNVLNMHILDAQVHDLQKLLGANFFNDLVENYSTADYKTLLNGGTYTYNSVVYTNYGLRVVLVHYAYARYVRFGQNIDTPFGLVVKQGENSAQSSSSDKKAIYADNQTLAFNYWENVKQFLDRNTTTYTKYRDNCVVDYRILKIRTIS